MLKKISIFCAKLLIILLIVIMGSLLILPAYAKAELPTCGTNIETYASLEATAKDPLGNKMTNVSFNIYEQLKDINNQPILGKQLASGYIGDSGSQTIKIRTNGCLTINFAGEYFRQNNEFEKFKIWDQLVRTNEIKKITLTFSAVKIIIKDQDNNLLKNQSFDIYTAATDASGKRVADKQIQWSQTTGTLGYKIFYLIPGNYIARVESKDYPFIVNLNKQTVLTIVVNITADPLPPGDVYATIKLITKDPFGIKVENVNFAVFEQKKDVNNKPVFGERLADGYIGVTGEQTVKIKMTGYASRTVAVEYFKQYSDFEKFKVWDQVILPNQTKTITLTFSSVKIIVKDQNNNLLKDKPFDIFSTALDANNNRVADKQTQWGQTTGNLGYKIFYLIPGNYDARANSKDNFFIITAGQQTDLTIIVNITEGPTQPGDIYTTINLASKNAFGNKVPNVNFTIYEQKSDINGRPVFGDRITDGYIGETGEQTVKIRMNNYDSRKIAVEYFKEWRTEGRFAVWDQLVYPNQSKSITLVFSTARVVLKDGNGQLLKNFYYDIYSAVTDYSGKKVAKDNLYGGQQTGAAGEKTYYLIPNDYILHLRYPDVYNVEDLNYLFTVNKDRQTDVIYNLSNIKVSARQANGDLRKYAEFRLFKKSSDNLYKEIGYFNTGEDYKIVYLPAASYKIEFKDTSGNWSQNSEFYLSAGQEKVFGYSNGGLHLKVTDVAGNSLTNLKVSVFKYVNNQKQDYIGSAITDINGKVKINLSKGTYIAEIEGLYRNLIYTTRSFTADDNYITELTYPLSQANIFLKDSQGQNVSNNSVDLYRLTNDNNGNPIAGEHLGNFWIGSKAYIETYLPAGHYLIKVADKTNLYPFNIEMEKLNVIYIHLQDSSVSTTAILPPNISTATDSISYLFPTLLNSDSLYNADSDNDGLANFEEYYIWRTNVYNADSDNDGYNDLTEIRNNYNPNGSGRYYYDNFSYGKPRAWSLLIEQDKAVYLRAELLSRLGRDLGVNAADWSTLVNAYIYGGYSIEEIKNTLVYGPGEVHPTIPAVSWRKR